MSALQIRLGWRPSFDPARLDHVEGGRKIEYHEDMVRLAGRAAEPRLYGLRQIELNLAVQAPRRVGNAASQSQSLPPPCLPRMLRPHLNGHFGHNRPCRGKYRPVGHDEVRL